MEALDRARAVRFQFDWQELTAAPGETIAVALLAAGVQALRTTSRREEPRGLFCNMGVCFDCLVEVDGHANQRACQVVVREGMQVRTQRGHGYTDVAPELGE
jgi:predicted molibdopterin-dependent oxidoreductase YjgC